MNRRHFVTLAVGVVIGIQIEYTEEVEAEEEEEPP